MKKTVSLVCILTVFVLLFSSCSSNGVEGDISGYANNKSIVGRDIPALSVADDGSFSILQFSDTHLINGSTKKDVKTLEAIKTQLDEEKPDLVVVSGDMIEGKNKNKKYNKKAGLEAIASLFEESKQYWAYVPGNNDGELMGTSEDVAAFLSQYSYCILADEENLTGAVQYTVDLTDKDGKTVHCLAFMDSLARDEENHYDYMKADQVEWAKKIIDEKKAAHPEIKFSFFFHMNTPNFAVSGKNGKPYKDGYAPVPNDFYEGIDGNAALDKVFSDSECVGLVSIGHIHPENNYCSFLNGTYYHIVRSAGYNVSKEPGCVKITVRTAEKNTSDMYEFSEIIF